jgi:DNA-binding MarR family transcriptional regulator
MRLPDETLGAWRAFLSAHALATKRINRDLAEAGLPDLTWYDVLWALHRADGRRLRIRELADAVVLSSTGMTRFVDRLEAAGLVRREAVPGDRRGAYAVITKEGSALLRRMWPIYARDRLVGVHELAVAQRHLAQRFLALQAAIVVEVVEDGGLP